MPARLRKMIEEGVDIETFLSEMAQEHNHNLERKSAEQKEQVEKIEQTGNDRDKSFLRELQTNVEELRQLNEQVEQGQIESMPVYDDPTRPGSSYLEQIDYEIWKTRDPDTQALFREFQEEASWWRREIGRKLRPWMY